MLRPMRCLVPVLFLLLLPLLPISFARGGGGIDYLLPVCTAEDDGITVSELVVDPLLLSYFDVAQLGDDGNVSSLPFDLNDSHRSSLLYLLSFFSLFSISSFIK